MFKNNCCTRWENEKSTTSKDFWNVTVKFSSLYMNWLWQRRARWDLSFCGYGVTAELLPGDQGIIQPADVWTSVHQDLASASLQPHPCQASSPRVRLNEVVRSNAPSCTLSKNSKKRTEKGKVPSCPRGIATAHLSSGPSADVGSLSKELALLQLI